MARIVVIGAVLWAGAATAQPIEMMENRLIQQDMRRETQVRQLEQRIEAREQSRELRDRAVRRQDLMQLRTRSAPLVTPTPVR
ncbi:hypothetical protein [Acuticoccus sp.]|uniref:hypothetical protein n=1 Tax=Acuticoccus sp. TaxID=1904378 RepID=UPI003B51AB00